MKQLALSFYRRKNVLDIAQDLMGKILITQLNGVRTSGRIVELEAYAGISDKASHAWAGRRTKRNEIMYARGGYTYVYLCYGIHHLFNVVTGDQDTPHAILLRSLEPVEGIPIMLKRSGKTTPDYSLTRGPGNLSRAMGITTAKNAVLLNSKEISLADDGFNYPKELIASSPRIGVDYAGEDALLPYRFYIKGNPFVSARPR